MHELNRGCMTLGILLTCMTAFEERFGDLCAAIENCDHFGNFEKLMVNVEGQHKC